MSLVTTNGLVSPLVIDIENITKDYVMGEEIVHALRGVSLQIRSNEYLAIMGPSGSGKSTLMNMLGCLDTPSSGRYEFNGRDVSAMSDDELVPSSQRSRHCTHPSASLTRHTRPHRSGAKCCPASDTSLTN